MKRIVRKVLQSLGVSQGYFSVTFVSRQKITALNTQYLRHHFATDVLAFDLSDAASVSLKKKVSGDIIVSVDAALKQARAFETSISYELILYVVHGILHLMGYNDHRPADIKKIRRKENEIMNSLGSHVKTVVAR